ncbi:hypothetical protein BIV57_10075 [Mangrovactinospora gilvigrisea]|uniref:Uncharacterized protein n=1 Tax=Mangrovactinospora gilvigrisea TaxID=1428644 RepID=A0A1J7C7X9_9ACTN|nr:hypothetical protein [Mangrovactinospora gilvigrisea]OIV37640.1 hypothetical protein BIV57_10075 [Mangrovactinospora gilvigrisea]
MERDTDLELFRTLAERLKHAHALVQRLDAPESVRRTLTRRLLAITAAAKRDLGGAARRLDGFLAELEARR